MRPSTSYNKAVIKRTSFFIAVCLAAVLSSISVGVNAQIYTTTLPWVDGDTIIVSQSTNANGATIAIQTLSTIPALAGAATTARTTGTGLVTTTPGVPAVTTSRTTTTRAVTTAAAVTTTPGVVQPVTTGPSSTSYYFYTSNGVVYSTYFSPTFTAALTPTGVIPAGTILEFSSYISSIEAAAQTALASGTSAAGRAVSIAEGGAAWVLATIGAGVVAGVYLI